MTASTSPSPSLTSSSASLTSPQKYSTGALQVYITVW